MSVLSFRTITYYRSVLPWRTSCFRASPRTGRRDSFPEHLPDRSRARPGLAQPFREEVDHEAALAAYLVVAERHRAVEAVEMAQEGELGADIAAHAKVEALAEADRVLAGQLI